MPYARNIDLPENVLKDLPAPAQETYRKAFNNAWNNYRQADAEALEDVAHLVAWASVEQNFHKTPRGQWVPD
ncbi:cation transport regulator ChaB [Proteobacteria bacterium 005FR1]|nr:cation transport regulator ChaB [Proteobacteria bacterium 005FR1]